MGGGGLGLCCVEIFWNVEGVVIVWDSSLTPLTFESSFENVVALIVCDTKVETFPFRKNSHFS